MKHFRETRSKKIDVRLTENEYNQIESEAQKNNMSASAYARWRLVYHDHYGVSAEEIDKRHTEELVTIEKHVLQNKLSQLEYYIELLPNKNKNKDAMKELVNESWHLLK